MRLATDERAQAIQIGAVLIFGILIILLAIYQAFVIPDQNEEIEFNHNQEVQEELTELRSTAISMADVGTVQSSSVNLGVRYPSRTIFVNPNPVSGNIRTIETGNESFEIAIEGATAEDDEMLGVGDFWDGTDRSFNTGAIEYRPNYNLYQEAPRTTYEHSVLLNDFERQEQSIPLTDQALVSDDQISIVAINGSYDETRVGKASIDFRPVSTETQTVDIEPDSGESFTIEFPTTVNTNGWEEVFMENDDVSVSTSGNMVELEITGSYTLQLAKVGVGTAVSGTEAEYLAGIEGHESTISEGESQELTVEVRDKFNKPQRGVTINGSAEGGDLDTAEMSTNRDGQATFEFTPSTSGTHDINFSFSYAPEAGTAHDASAPTNLTKEVTVESDDPGAGEGQSAFNSTWSENIPDEIDCYEEEPCEVDLDMGTDPTADDVPISFGVNDTSLASVSPTSSQTSSDGTADTTLEPEEDGTVKVFTWGGGSGDSAQIELINATEPGFNVEILDVDDPVNQGDVVDVDVEITNSGGQTETQTVTLDVEDEGQVDDETIELDGGETTTTSLQWDTSDTESGPGQYDLTVESEDDSDTETTNVLGLSFTGESEAYGGDIREDGIDSILTFNVTNERSDDVIPEAITIENTDTDADFIENQDFEGDEILVNTDGGSPTDDTDYSAAGAFDIGETIDLDAEADPATPISSGSKSVWDIAEFLEDINPVFDEPVDMSGAEVSIAITYSDSDGDEHTHEFTIQSVG